MPRCSALSVDQIFNVLKRKIVFTKDGKVIKKSEKLWKEASLSLGKVVCESTLYFYVLKNWNKLGDKLKEYYLQNENFQSASCTQLEEKVIDTCPKLKFKIDLNEEEWQKIKPVLKKKGKKLPKGWTHAIMKKIWICKKLPCPYSFKKGYVSKKNDSISFKGYCTECGNQIKGIQVVTSESHEFEINTQDSRCIRHFKKRPLSGPLRDESQNVLLHDKPLKYKRHEAETLLEYGDVEGPLVHGTPVLRKSRQDGIFRKYGITSTKNIVHAILSMKATEKYAEIIKQVGDFPFNVVFWTPEQMDFWNTISSVEDLTVSLDAAGCFVKKIRIGNEVSSHIFLYIMSTSIGGKIYPLFQFLSEYHAAIFLKDCLNMWVDAGASKPKQVTTDGSSALQNTICLVFNNCTYKEYLLSCHNKVLGLQDNLPTCFLRLDIAHLIKSITRWNCFGKTSPNIKDFYLRNVAYLSTVSSYEDFIKIITSIFIVSLSPGIENNSEVDKSLKFLFELIKTHECSYCKEDCSCDFCNEKKLENVETETNEAEKSDLSSIESEIEKIKSNALTSICEVHSNEFYCPDFIKNFTSLCTEYPTWTNIMLDFFNTNIEVATSGRSESLFCDLRHITNVDRPISGHLFIAIYCEFLDGAMKLGRGYLENQKLLSTKAKNSMFIESTLVGSNFDKSVVIKKKKKRGKYLEPCMDVQIQYNQPNRKPLKNIIINGILSKPVQHKKQTYVYKSSCLFDSTMELCIAAYSNYADYQATINDSCKDESCFGAIMIEFCSTGKVQILNKKRFQLCLRYFDIKLGILYYEQTIGHFISQLFSECTKEVYYVQLQHQIKAELLNLTELGSYIQESLKTQTLAKYVYIDIQDFSTNQMFNLQNIPVRLLIDNKTYMLFGAIAYNRSEFNCNLLHYFTYCRTLKNNWILKDDLAKKFTFLKEKSVWKIYKRSASFAKINKQ